MITQDDACARYCAQRTVQHRNELVTAYRHLALRGARKFKRRYNDRADLEQVASLGLIKAAQNYRADMQTPFDVYAWIVVVGELMHYVRDHERMVRVPRKLATLEKRLLVVWEEFVARHQREPSTAELAAELQVSPATIEEARSLAQRAHAWSRGPLRDAPDALDALAAPAADVSLEERLSLAAALEELGERERAIVVGTYASGLTQSEIAAQLGLSQSHISKLLSRALAKLSVRVA